VKLVLVDPLLSPGSRGAAHGEKDLIRPSEENYANGNGTNGSP